jgi:hypothetical protein
MTDTPQNPNPGEPGPTPDPASSGPGPDAPKATAATALLDSIRDAFDDIAERAAPAVREVSARAAELTADVAGRAAPYARKAGDATADASSKLAERSKTWAAGVRAAIDEDAAKHESSGPAAWGEATTVTDAPAETTNASNGAATNGSAPSGEAPDPDAPSTDH